MTQPDNVKVYFRAAGAFFFMWAGYNTYLDISRYGLGWGLYWWFCNLATFAIGIALYFRNRALLIAFVSIALFTQIFWILDNTYRLLTGKVLFGLVGSMYQPGLPLDEFISVHYHYFTIPVALFALFYLPPTPRRHSFLTLAVLNPFIFLVSYFIFPSHQNINCIHSACHPNLNWQGPVYSISFWGVVFLLHCAVAWSLERIFHSAANRWRYQRTVNYSFAVVLLAVMVITYQDVQYKLTLPGFKCAQSTKTPTDLLLRCEYTRDNEANTFLLTYTASNHRDHAGLCDVFLRRPAGEELILQGLSVASGQSRELTAVIPNPTITEESELFARCH